MLAGYVFLTTTLLTAVIPTGVKVTRMAVHKLDTNLSPANVADVLVFLVLNFGELFLAGYLAARSWRRRTRPAAPAAPPAQAA
jgi:hypothetical protein